MLKVAEIAALTHSPNLAADSNNSDPFMLRMFKSESPNGTYVAYFLYLTVVNRSFTNPEKVE